MKRYLIAAEVAEEDAEDFLEAIEAWLKTKAPDITYGITEVIIRDIEE
jgi:hypothetical protein